LQQLLLPVAVGYPTVQQQQQQQQQQRAMVAQASGCCLLPAFSCTSKSNALLLNCLVSAVGGRGWHSCRTGAGVGAVACLLRAPQLAPLPLSCLVLLTPCSGSRCSRRPCVLCPCVGGWWGCPRRGGPWWPAPQTPQPAGQGRQQQLSSMQPAACTLRHWLPNAQV
jgi:hypothetical protein